MELGVGGATRLAPPHPPDCSLEYLPQADSPVPSPDSENGTFSVRYSVTYYINRFTCIIQIIY